MNESFREIDCTGTDNQKQQGNHTTYTRIQKTQKNLP